MPRVLLPPEISCDVVRCLDSTHDKETLFACSLTCKAFLSVSRRTLFEIVELFWPPGLGSFDARFVELIQASPKLGAAVKRLVLSFPGVAGSPLPASGVLADLDRGLPNVTDLQIQYLFWTGTDPECRSALLSGFQAVKSLILTYPKFEFSHDTTELISSFPLLTHLHIDGDAWDSVVPLPRYSPLPVNLTTVAIAADNAGVFAELMGLESRPKVQSLSLEFVSDDHNYNVGSLLKALGGDLRELVFLNSMAMRAGARALRNSNGEQTLESPFSYIYVKHLRAGIDLRHNTQLRHFTYRFRVPDAGSTVCDFLSQIKSSQLEQVTLMIPVASVNELKDVEWERMEGILTARSYAKLQTLAVSCFDEGDDDDPESGKDYSADVPALVRPRMPELSKRGILRVKEHLVGGGIY